MNFFLKKYIKNNLILIGILILSFFLRFYRIEDYMTFLGDEGRDVLTVYNILHGHLTLLGPTSSVGGFFLGPIYYYFMAPFLFIFNYNPVGPAVMIAILGVITVYLVYYIGSKFFNKTTGLIAAFIYAISPLVVFYSRSSWNPNPMPFFTILCLLFLYRGVINSKNKFIFISGVLYGILMQLHYIETFLGVSIFFYIIIYNIVIFNFFKKVSGFKRIYDQIKSDIKIFAFFICGFLVGFFPYIAFEFRHKFVNTLNIINFIFHSKDVGSSGNFFLRIYDVFVTIFGKTLFFYPPSNSAVASYGRFNIDAILISLLGFLTILYFLIIFYRSFKDRNIFFKYLLLAVWFFIPLLIFGFYKKNIYDYYFEFLYPVIVLLFSGFIYFLFNFNFSPKVNKLNISFFVNLILKIIGFLLICYIIFISVNYSPIKNAPNRQVYQTESIARAVLKETGNKPFNFALITGGNSDFAYRYFLTIWGHAPVTIQPPYLDPQRTTVMKQLIVVCESIPCYPLGNPLFEIAGFGRASIADKTNVSFIQIYKLIHYKSK